MAKKTSKKSSKSSKKAKGPSRKTPKKQTLNKYEKQLVAQVNEIERSVKANIANYEDRIAQLENEIKSSRESIITQQARLALAVKSALVINPLLKLKSAEAVRKFLKNKKIKGLVGDASECPIANYLKTAGTDDVQVGCELQCDGISLAVPDALNRFIGKFDDGKFKDLIDANKASFYK